MEGIPQKRPKRPLTAYNLYFQEERQRILNAIPDVPEPHEGSKGARRVARKAHGKISFADLARVVAGKWKQLSESDRRPYVERALIDKNRYQMEMMEWKRHHQSDKAPPVPSSSSLEESHNDSTDEASLKPPATLPYASYPASVVQHFQQKQQQQQQQRQQQPQQQQLHQTFPDFGVTSPALGGRAGSSHQPPQSAYMAHSVTAASLPFDPLLSQLRAYAPVAGQSTPCSDPTLSLAHLSGRSAPPHRAEDLISFNEQLTSRMARSTHHRPDDSFLFHEQPLERLKRAHLHSQYGNIDIPPIPPFHISAAPAVNAFERIADMDEAMPSTVVDPQRPPQGQTTLQGRSSDNSELQEFLDGIDDETKEHFLRSVLDRPPQPPPSAR